MNHRRSIFPAFFLIAIGVFFLLRNAELIHGKLVPYIIAVGLIFWGISKLIIRGD